MEDALLQLLMNRARQPAPIQDSVQRTAFPRERPAIIPQRTRSHQATPLSPPLTSVMGGLLDAASTYAFLKRGNKTEDNRFVSGLSKHPAALGALGAVSTLAIQPAFKRLGKKWPRFAKALQANQGALQLGYGAGNFQNSRGLTSDHYRDALHRSLTEDVTRRSGY